MTYIYMSIKNYIEGDINDIHLIVNSHKINTYDLNIDGKVQIKSENGDIVNYTTPSKGNAGEQLTIDANGNTYWGVSGGTGGVSNPMSEDLNGNSFNINNVNNITNLITSSDLINVNNIQSKTTNDIYISADGILTAQGDAKVYVESSDNVNISCLLGAQINMTNDIQISGQTVYIGSNTNIVNMMGSILSNVNDINGFVKYRIVNSGSTVNFNGRLTVNVSTTSTTPLLLFKRQYTNNCSIFDGRFMASNHTQNKIWCCPAVCVVDTATIDKNIAGSGVSSIGGTTRASTIDFNLNAGYLECWITPNFNDQTTNIFECSIWSDTL